MTRSEYANPGYSTTGVNGYPSSAYSWRGHTWTKRTITLSSNDILSLIGKLQESVQDHSFNALVSMAELPETLGAVVKSAKNFYDAYRDVSKGNFGDAARSLSRVVSGSNNRVPRPGGRRGPKNRPDASVTDVADTWLSLKWGWLPLLNDIHEAMNAYDANRNPQRTYRTRVRKTCKALLNINDQGEGSGQGGPFYANAHGSTEYRVVYKELNVLDSLGLTNPAAVVWEKIPFSCVLDWFIPIGDYFAARGFLNTLSYQASRTMFSRCEGVRHSEPCNTGYRQAYKFPHNTGCSGISSPKNQTDIQSVHSRASTWCKHVWMTRSANIALSAPKPSMKALEKAFSTDHMATLGALFTSIASGGSSGSTIGSRMPHNSRGLRDFFS